MHEVRKAGVILTRGPDQPHWPNIVSGLGNGMQCGIDPDHPAQLEEGEQVILFTGPLVRQN